MWTYVQNTAGERHLLESIIFFCHFWNKVKMSYRKRTIRNALLFQIRKTNKKEQVNLVVGCGTSSEKAFFHCVGVFCNREEEMEKRYFPPRSIRTCVYTFKQHNAIPTRHAHCTRQRRSLSNSFLVDTPTHTQKYISWQHCAPLLHLFSLLKTRQKTQKNNGLSLDPPPPNLFSSCLRTWVLYKREVQ